MSNDNPGNAERLSRTAFYPIRDPHPQNRPFGSVRAKWSGEKRPPRKGEWYLSGSIIEAYRAGGDLSYPYHIATLYRVQHVETWVPIEQLNS